MRDLPPIRKVKLPSSIPMDVQRDIQEAIRIHTNLAVEEALRKVRLEQARKSWEGAKIEVKKWPKL